jgi:hypothetical protein
VVKVIKEDLRIHIYHTDSPPAACPPMVIDYRWYSFVLDCFASRSTGF